MKSKVDYINIELLVHTTDGSSCHTPYVVAKEYDGVINDQSILFADACTDLVLLEKLGIDCSLCCYTYSVMEGSKK